VLSPHGSPESLLRLLDPTAHAKRRRLWDRAFTPSALKSYQPLLSARVAELRAHLLARAGVPLDLARWMLYFTTDFMGDFAWGGKFSLMAAGADTAHVHRLGTEMLGKTEVLGTMPWLRPLLRGYPAKWRALTAQAVHTRIEKGSAFRDLFYYLVSAPVPSCLSLTDAFRQLDEDRESTHAPLPYPTLVTEGSLAIIAGSDTSGLTLANAMFFLLTRPDAHARLRAELDSAAVGAAPESEIDAGTLAELPFLRAVVDETLRLQPPVPNGVQRMPPPDGGPVVVAGQYAPRAHCVIRTLTPG
jgi:cytochrome P450